jgi:hypothetical protein
MTILLGLAALFLVLVFAPIVLMALFSLALILIDLLIVIPIRILLFLLTFPIVLLGRLGGVVRTTAGSAWARFHRGR